MYQFERSSTNASKARITFTVSVASYASSASRTSSWVRSTSQRSRGRSAGGPVSRSAGIGSKPEMFA